MGKAVLGKGKREEGKGRGEGVKGKEEGKGRGEFASLALGGIDAPGDRHWRSLDSAKSLSAAVT